MKNKLKLVGTLAVVSLLTACSGGSYKIKSESGNVVNTVPKWYMADFSEQKACDLSYFTSKDDEKQCIYGVGTAVSPDLNLAIEKAKMISKAELADIVAGKMNKQSKQFITELGKTEKRTVVTEAESILVNEIAKTPVRGYEVFAQDVTLTRQGYYRAWIGLRLPMGEFNKMYNYTVEQAVNAYSTKTEDKNVFDDFMSSIEEGENENNSVQ